MTTQENLIKREITIKKAMTMIIILCFFDMTVTYFALNRQMQKYPDTWREKELSFTVGPLLRTLGLDIIPALAIGLIINSLIYITAIRAIKTEFAYGLLSGALILAILSNARIAWMT